MKNVQRNANVLKNGNVEGNVCEERHESVQCNANVEGNTQLHGDAKGTALPRPCSNLGG